MPRSASVKKSIMKKPTTTSASSAAASTALSNDCQYAQLLFENTPNKRSYSSSNHFTVYSFSPQILNVSYNQVQLYSVRATQVRLSLVRSIQVRICMVRYSQVWLGTPNYFSKILQTSEATHRQTISQCTVSPVRF